MFIKQKIGFKKFFGSNKNYPFFRLFFEAIINVDNNFFFFKLKKNKFPQDLLISFNEY